MCIRDRTYTEYFSASRQFIQEQKTNPAVWDARQFLFYRYLLLMVDALPLKKVLAPITLCVDFSFGEAYNLSLIHIYKRGAPK